MNAALNAGDCPSESTETMTASFIRLREGKLDGFDRFYERVAPLVMGIAVRILHDKMEAEDVCHDVLLEVMTKPARYDRERGTVEAWLTVLTKSRCLDRLRKRNRLVAMEKAETESRESACGEEMMLPEKRVLAKLEEEALLAALRGLPAAQLRTLAAAYYEERSHAELARAWHVPIGTVKSRVRYGLRHLRKQLETMSWSG